MEFYFNFQKAYQYICSSKLNPMKKIIISCLFVIIGISTVSAQEFNKKYFDKRAGREILIDHCNRAGLEEGAFGQVYANQYAAYSPNTDAINSLKPMLENITIKMVFGSWCYDSKMQVPRFMKVLDEIGFDENQMSIIGVDRMKKPQEASIDGLKIRYVPTFIVYREGVEIGRIVENPKKSLEQDLLKILQ